MFRFCGLWAAIHSSSWSPPCIAHGCYYIVFYMHFPPFTLLVCLFWVIVVVELNCEIHIAHNLKNKTIKGEIHSFILH